jgi:hypothetical protein
MKNLKHILVVVALLATMVPCVHAAAHHDHHHDADMGLCEVEAEPCSCHSCEHPPYADRVETQIVYTPDLTTIEHPAIPDRLFALPEEKPALQNTRPPGVGILAALQTVQLLI